MRKSEQCKDREEICSFSYLQSATALKGREEISSSQYKYIFSNFNIHLVIAKSDPTTYNHIHCITFILLLPTFY